jgi:hypothetical protein
MHADTTTRYAWWLVNHCEIFADIEDKIGGAAELVRIIRDVYFPAWQSHPSFSPSTSEDPHNPHFVGVWEHEAFQGHAESLVFARLNEILCPAVQEWGKRTLGKFKCVRPILPEHPHHPERIIHISWSLKGAGRAFRCRQELKRLLPSRFHPLIGHARSQAKKPKWMHLKEWGQHDDGEREALRHLRKKSALPDWYTSKTRDQFNREQFLSVYADRLAGIHKYITPANFWMAATGQCHPDDVQNLVTHQMMLPGISE